MRGLVFSLLMVCAGVASAQEFTTLKGHGGPIMGLAVSAQGRVASASFDNSAGLWTGQDPQWLDGHDAAVTAITWGHAGKRLVTGGDDFTVRLWENGIAQVLGKQKGKIAALAVSPDGSHVASGSWDGSIILYALDGGADRLLPSPGSNVNALAYSADGTKLFAATQTGVVLTYDLSSQNKPRPIVRHGFGVNRLITGPGWLAYGAVDGGTRVIDPDTGTQIADFTLDRRPILSLAYHDATQQLAVGDGQGYIMMVDTQDWKIIRDYKATRQGPVWALAFSPDGSVIYAGGLDDAIYAWPVALLGEFAPVIEGARSFLRDADTMPNGERQFMRKCSICHSLTDTTKRKAGPTLRGVFGRRAGTVPGYAYSNRLSGSKIIWTERTIDALFDIGPDHFIPGSKMPMQVIAKARDRADLVSFLKSATQEP